jgi:hypothetical protein
MPTDREIAEAVWDSSATEADLIDYGTECARLARVEMLPYFKAYEDVLASYRVGRRPREKSIDIISECKARIAQLEKP